MTNHYTSTGLTGAVFLLLTAAIVPAGVQAADAQAKELTIVSWGGVYQESQRKAYFTPFTEKTGIVTKEDNYPGDFGKVVEQVESDNVRWDVVDVTLSDAIRGCDNGQLEPIPPTLLEPAPDGTAAMKDFLPNTMHACAVGQYVWSTLWAYDKRQFEGTAPNSLEDVFNVDAFPGERGMRKTPNNNLEWALMAAGVDQSDIYSTLSTEAGQKKAFEKLDSIRDSIRWWEDGSKPQQWLSQGEVAFSTGYNGRIFNTIVKQEQPLDYIWDGQMLQVEAWVIPRGAPHLANALKFIRFATSTQSMAELTEHVSYAPARKSSLPLVRRAYQRHMPTSPMHRRNALQSSFVWWSENQEDMDEHFDAWLGQG